MGPPPKDPSQRRRRNADVVMTVLPSEGRKGRTPAWPLPPDVKLASDLEGVEEEIGRVEESLDEGDGSPGPLRAKLSRLKVKQRRLHKQLQLAETAEKEMWKALWGKPQAKMWERNKTERAVAQYVRWKVKAEFGDIEAGREARMLEDRLGLNDLAMLRLRWKVAEDEVAARRSDGAAKSTTRKRLRAVDSG